MERRVRGNVLARCGRGEKAVITSKPYLFLSNRSPVSDFVCEPNPAYEGDNVICKNLSTDPDGDVMIYQWTVSGPNGYKATYTTTDIAILGSVTENYIGDYTVTLRATDSKGETNLTDTQKIVQILPLMVKGSVTHTAAWEKNRIEWNLDNPLTPRSVNTYWAGEEFLLNAVTTDTGNSTTKAIEVHVSMGGNTTDLTSTNSIYWSGSLWEENFDNLSEGPYTFTFTAKYSNGVKKVDNVTVNIKGSIWDVTKTHRLE